MRRYIPGLCSQQQHINNLDGFFLVRVDSASYRWHPHKPFLALQFEILEPAAFSGRSFSGRIHCTERTLWKLNWFLQDFGYDQDLLGRSQIDEKALINLRGVVRTTFTQLNGRSYQSLDAFSPAAECKVFPREVENRPDPESSSDDL